MEKILNASETVALALNASAPVQPTRLPTPAELQAKFPKVALIGKVTKDTPDEELPVQNNSNQFYRDTGTWELFSVDTPRYRKSSYDAATNKYVWPTIKCTNGEVVRVAYKFFTEDEKADYRPYWNKGHDGTSTGTPRAQRVDVEKLDAIWALCTEHVQSKSALAEIKELLDAMRPEDPAMRKAKAALGALTPEQIAALMATLQK